MENVEKLEYTTIPFLLTLNPTVSQTQSFKGILGSVRYAYNLTLAHVIQNWEENKDKPKEEQSYISTYPYELAKWIVSVKDDIAPWNREYSKYVFQSGAENVGHAFQNPIPPFLVLLYKYNIFWLKTTTLLA